MNRTERKRLARREKRCDWLETRITRGTAKKRDMSFDIAELSALRWVIQRIQTTPDELCEKNRHFELKINRQRKVIRTLVAYQQRIALTDAEPDALSDAAALRGEWP